MPVDREAVGRRGEAIVTNLLTRMHGRAAPFFRPLFMGDKTPVIDFFVELISEAENVAPFFLVQVKATTQGYTRHHPIRLKARVSSRTVSDLVKYPAPTFVIGVDEQNEVSFILAVVDGGLAQLSSFPTSYSLADLVTIQGLYDEVMAFWQTNAADFTASRFV